jgi:hypothetical protein
VAFIIVLIAEGIVRTILDVSTGNWAMQWTLQRSQKRTHPFARILLDLVPSVTETFAP